MHHLQAAMRGPVVALLALALSGCVGFVPPYDVTLDTKSTTAFEGVSKIDAQVELGAFEGAETYAKAEETYADILTNLRVADLRARSAPVSERGATATARDQLSKLLTSCKDKVQTIARRHRTSGLAPDAGLTESMVSSCDLAATAARALKK
jgi:hypothetical protein